MLLIALLVVLVLLAVGGLPVWPYAAGWELGYWPSGMLSLIVIAILIWALTAGPFGGRRGPLV